jgi:chloramphenicol-sensitive protein RarD
MLNGERIGSDELVIYSAIWLAVLVLVAGGVALLLRDRRSGTPRDPV